MARLTCRTALAMFAVAMAIPSSGTAQGQRKAAPPPIPPEQVAATVKRGLESRMAAFERDRLQKRQAAAQQVQAIASQLVAKFGTRPPRLRVDTTLPVVDTVVTAPGGADPQSIFEVLGSKLSPPGSRPEVHVLLAGKDLLGLYQAGSTNERVREIMPAFEGIAGPTPAQLYVRTAAGKSNLVPILLKPELVQQQVDLAALKSTLIAESHGDRLTYDEHCLGPDCFNVDGQWTIAGTHNAPINSAPVSGTDYYFASFKLKNNWVVKDTLWWNPVSNGAPGQNSAKATVTLGSSALSTAVNWWHNQGSANQAYYYITYVIEGPRGVPYK